MRHVPRWPRHAHASRSRRDGQPCLSIIVVLLLLALIASGLLASPSLAQDPTHPGQRTVLVFIGEHPGETTVLQRLALQNETDPANTTLAIGVPLNAERHEVTGSDGRRLQWAQTSAGVLQVRLAEDVDAVDVASRGVTATSSQPLRFGAQDQADPLWFVVATPPAHHERPENLQSVTEDDLLTSGAFPADWPLPAGWSYHWNEGGDTRLPTTLEMTATGRHAPFAPLALAAGLGVVIGLFTLWLVVRIHRGIEDPTRQRKQPIMGHLEELRRRLTIIAGVLLIATVFFFSFGFRWIERYGIQWAVPWPTIHGNAASQLFDWLARRIVPPGVEVVVVAPFDAVFTLIVLSLALALLVAFPVLFYHAYAFLAPALHPPERRLVLVSSPAIVVLFAAGAAFGLLLMAPLIVTVLYGFATAAGAIAFLTMPQLVSIAALLALVFSLAFQLPLVMMLTARMGLVRAATYREKWRWALVIIVIVAALVTDPTVITQIIVAVVLLALYAIGLVLAWIADRRRIEPREAD